MKKTIQTLKLKLALGNSVTCHGWGKRRRVAALPMGMLATLLLLAMLTASLRAGVFVLAGSGPTIPANSVTNFAGLAPIGTFQLYPQNIYLTTGFPVTATNGLVVFGRLTFDGTNFFTIAQTFSNPATNAALNGAQWAVTNTSFVVYGAISVSNLTAVPITNFQAQLQF